MAMTFPTAEAIPDGHAWADASGRFPDDKSLREFGFTILSRRGYDEPWWERGGRFWTQSAAMEQVKREQEAAMWAAKRAGRC